MLSKVGNISKCSQMLNISQQGLSRQISTMEDELNTTLFIRTSKGVQLTEEGKLLLPGFEEAYQSYEHAVRTLDDYRNSHRRTLRIAVCPGIKQALGLSFFTDFQAEHPEILLKTEFRSDVECEDRLYNDEADGAFLDWPQHRQLYDCIPVIRSPLVAVMRSDDPLASNPSLSMHALAGRTVYIPDESHRMLQRFAENWPEFYSSVNIGFTSNDYDSFYKELPKTGKGIALTFRFLTQDLDSELKAVPIIEESHVELYYCTKKNHPKDDALKTFSDCVKETLRQI